MRPGKRRIVPTGSSKKSSSGPERRGSPKQISPKQISPKQISLKQISGGFTILEVMIVLVLIGMIMGLVGPQLFKQLEKSKVQTAETQVKLLRTALQTMYLDMQRFPQTEEGLDMLVKQPASEDGIQWAGPYLSDELPLDPWNHGYVYQLNEDGDKPFYLYSFGADGKQGGTGVDRDVGLVPDQDGG